MTAESKQKIKKIPYLTSLIKPGEIMHIMDHLLPLDDKSPYGNLQLSWANIVRRTVAVNELIDKVNLDFKNFMELVEIQKSGRIGNDQNVIDRQKLNGELLVNTLKITADQILCLISILSSRKEDGTYATKISINRIGEFLNSKSQKSWISDIARFAPLLRELNDTSNAFKHSFLNLQSNTYYHGTPGVITYYLRYNNLSKKPELCTLLLTDTLKEFNDFLSKAKVIVNKLK